MKPSPFSYYAPKTLDDAIAALAAVAPHDGRVIAGGQSLVAAMALRLAQPAHLVDINAVAGLDSLEIRDGELCIGACVRHTAFEHPVVDGPLGAFLTTVVHHIAHRPIRTRGTFCGSIVNADPASEWCLVAATLGAKMVARSTRGTRTIAEPGFVEGIMTTVLAPDELLIEVRLPLLSAGTRCGFNEFSRRAGDFAIAMSVATYRIEGGVIVEPRVGVGAVESRARRIPEAEAALRGQVPADEAFAIAADAAAHAVTPIEEKPELAEYKREVVRAVVKRALAAAETIR
ncbi:MAG TPA: FAD binding domain-containing protein [Burkholderiales bacterium]|nr:FAD binding domain-containing protein [Burkholderiales bacterium]